MRKKVYEIYNAYYLFIYSKNSKVKFIIRNSKVNYTFHRFK